MKPGALVLGAVVSVILLAAAGVLYMMANDNGERQYRRSINAVQQIQRLSSDWSIEVTRVKSNPLADFDSLASFIPRMTRLKGDLAQTAHRIPDLPDRLANSINAYISAIDAKEERVERFKTGYAVVRNSARYLPLAATNVVRQAEELEDEKLARDVAAFIQEVELYLATPTDPAQTRLLSRAERLREASVSYPPTLSNALSNLFAHAEVLLTKQAPTEELFRDATSNAISNLTDELESNLRFELGRTEVQLAYYDRGMLVVIALLALFWILLALHQRRRGGALAAPAAGAFAPPAAAVASPHPAGDRRPMPAPAAPAPAATASAAAAAPEAAPAERDLEAATVNGFVVKCAAGTLAASAEQIGARMDYLRQTQQHLQNALDNSDTVAELPDGVDLDEEMAALAAISTSVRQEASSMSDLAKRLESVSAMPNSVNRAMTDINACVEGAVASCGPDAAAMITKRLGDVPEILASKGELRLLLKQIIENSMLAVRDLDERKGMIRIDTARKGDEILITVIDNGNGIAAESRMNIFQPFYTSREDAMGIGLTLAGHLVKQHEGVIKMNSLPGQGTVAQITLPAGIPNP